MHGQQIDNQKMTPEKLENIFLVYQGLRFSISLVTKATNNVLRTFNIL